MITPQLTEQYGQVERVSVARAIFSSRTCAAAGARSKPKTVAAAAPPIAPAFRKSLRVGFIPLPPLEVIAAIDALLGVVRRPDPCRGRRERHRVEARRGASH